MIGSTYSRIRMRCWLNCSSLGKMISGQRDKGPPPKNEYSGSSKLFSFKISSRIATSQFLHLREEFLLIPIALITSINEVTIGKH